MNTRAILLSASLLAVLLVLDGLDVLGTVVTAAAILVCMAVSLLALSSFLDTEDRHE